MRGGRGVEWRGEDRRGAAGKGEKRRGDERGNPWPSQRPGNAKNYNSARVIPSQGHRGLGPRLVTAYNRRSVKACLLIYAK